MKNLTNKEKNVVLNLGLLLVFILIGNSNNNPNMFIARIFKPVSFFGGTLYYSGGIIIFLLYYILKEFNKIKERYITKTRFRRIVSTILILELIPSLWIFPIKLYKSFQKDLKAIYFERDKSSLSLSRNNEEIKLHGYLKLINCSDEKQSFYLKVKIDYSSPEDSREGYITLNEEYKLMPKEENYIVINEEFSKNENSRFYIDIYKEIILFNEEKEVVFSREE